MTAQPLIHVKNW